MKFLLDVCVSSNVLRNTLLGLGHDVLSARDVCAGATDRALLDLAYREERVLITADKDFGELVFLLRLPHPCIVRLDGLTAAQEAASVAALIEDHGAAMQQGTVIVVSGSRVRMRSDVGVERSNDQN